MQEAPSTELKEVISNNASRFITALNEAAFNQQFPKLSGNEITERGLSSITALWEDGRFFCNIPELEVKLLKLNNGFEIRQIPLHYKEKDADGVREMNEGVLIFSESGLIDDIRFGIEHQQYSELLNASDDVADMRRRKIILDFVEDFRTAYNRKDLALIEQVFSDDALIIIGRVVQSLETDHASGPTGSTRVEYFRRKKPEYISQLKSIFENNQSINVRFDGLSIVQHPMHDSIYGVTLLQHWISTNYGDSGYLFLMIDFRDEDEPMIHVRTWQPEKEVTNDEVFLLSDFWITQRR
ncbi:MAG: hypothetical protein AB8G77_28645 [Rhodothermales bacterium]